MTRYRLPQPYEELDHTADAGVVVRGRSAEETLARLVLALGDQLAGGAPLATGSEMTISAEASDHASMAVDVLRELLYRFDAERIIPAECEVVKLDPASGAELVVGMAAYDPEAHVEGLDLKAVTLHDARFERDADGWAAQIIFDI